MKVRIIYDSAYGNTEKVAQAIGESLASQAEVSVLRVSDAKPDEFQNIDFLLVGSPTQSFRPLPSIKKFLDSIPKQALQGIRVAAYDTRADLVEVNSRILSVMVSIFGYAAKPIADGLVKKGGKLMAAPEGFFVQGKEGPLKDGELERAAAWAQKVMSSAALS